MSQSIDLSAVTEANFNGGAVDQINLNGSGIWTKPASNLVIRTRIPTSLANGTYFAKKQWLPASCGSDRAYWWWDISPANSIYITGGSITGARLKFVQRANHIDIVYYGSVTLGTTVTIVDSAGGGLPSSLMTDPQVWGIATGQSHDGAMFHYYPSELSTMQNEFLPGATPSILNTWGTLPSPNKEMMHAGISSCYNWAFEEQAVPSHKFDNTNPIHILEGSASVDTIVLGDITNGQVNLPSNKWVMTKNEQVAIESYGSTTPAKNIWTLYGIYNGVVYSAGDTQVTDENLSNTYTASQLASLTTKGATFDTNTFIETYNNGNGSGGNSYKYMSYTSTKDGEHLYGIGPE
jgi:hypothetical protein